MTSSNFAGKYIHPCEEIPLFRVTAGSGANHLWHKLFRIFSKLFATENVLYVLQMCSRFIFETCYDKNWEGWSLVSNLLDETVGFVCHNPPTVGSLIQLPVGYKYCGVIFIEPVNNISFFGWR